MVGTENGGRPDVSVVQEAPEYIESSEDAQSPDSPREVVDVNVPSSYSITYRVAEDDTPLNPEDNIIKSVAFIIDADESTSNLAKQSAELGSYMPGLDEIQPFVAALNNRYERDEDYKIIGWVNPNQNPAPNIGAGEDYVIYTDNQELYLNEPGFADIAQLELQGDTVLEARFVVQSWQPSYLGVSQNNEPEESQIAGSGVSSTDGDEEGAEENDSLSVEKDEIVTEVVSTLLALFGGISLLSSDMPITVTGATFTSSDFTTENPPYEILTSKKIRLDINWKVAAADMGSIEINTPYGISMHHDGMQFSNVTPTTFNIAIDEETVIENAGTFEVVRGTSSKDATLYITFTKDLSALGITEIKNETFWFEASSYRSEVSNAGGYIGDISLPVISVVPREDAGEWPGSTSDDFKKSSWRVTGADCVDWKILVNINELGKTQRGDYKESGAPTSYSNALIYDVLPNGTEICTSDNSTHADGAARELKIYVPILKVSSDGKLIDEEVYQALVSTQRVSIEASDFDAAKAAILSESAGSYDYWVNPDGQEVFLFNAGNLPAGSSGGLTLVKSQTEIAADIQSGNTSVTLTSAEKTATIASLNNIFAQSNEGVIGFYIRLSTEVVNPSLIESNNGEITNKVFLVSNEASKETEVTEENYVAIGGGAEGTLQKDEIEITKVDSEDSSITLDGAIFNLYKKDSSDPVEGSPATTVNGKVKFSGLTKGTYVIKEISSAPGYSLDGAELYLGSTKIESNDSGGYEFTIDPTTASAGLSFKMTNVKLGTSAGLAATKTLNGRDLIADEFGFTAELVSNNLTHVTAGLDEDGKTTTKNPGAQAGSAAALTFDSLTFDAADDYVFVITEDSGTLAGVSYDSSSFYAVVTVTDTGGALSAVVSYYASEEAMSAGEELADSAAPAFINSYSYIEYDAALRKWVSDVNNVIGDGKPETVPSDNLLNSIAQAESGTTSDAVSVAVDDYVTYTIRIYNQCALELQVPKIIDDLPAGLDFVTKDKDGKPVNDGWTVKNDILVYEYPAGAAPDLQPSRNLDGNFLNADGSYDASMYTDITVVLQVNIDANADNLRNTAEIAKLVDKDGNEVPDVDSVPDENPKNDTTKDNEIEEQGKDKDGNDVDVKDEDDNDVADLNLKPVVVSVEVDKDTIKRTSAAFQGRTHSVESSIAGVHIDNIGEEEYLYNFDFRSTSSIAADELNVIDSLEAVDHGHITVTMFVTPSVYGDKDGIFNVWVKTKSGTGVSHGSPAPSAHKVYANPASEGWTLWAGSISSTNRERLAIYASDTIGSYNLGLSNGDYITDIMLKYGAVEVGFTSRNADTEVSNGHHRDSNGVAAHYGTAIRQLAEHEKTNHEAALPKGETTNWTPNEERHDHSHEAAAAGGLAPASYMVTATQELQSTDLVSSVTAYIARGDEMKDADQDAVLTRQIDSFSTNTKNVDVDSLVSQDSFLQNGRNQGVTFNEGQVSLSLPVTGDQLKTIMLSILILAILAVAIVLIAVHRRQRAPEGVAVEVRKEKPDKGRSIRKLFILPILVLSLGAVVPLDEAFAAPGDPENMTVEYRYTEGDSAPDIPRTVTQFGKSYRLINVTDAVPESTLPSTRTYVFNISGALTPEQMADIALVPGVVLTPASLTFEREVDKVVTITGLPNNDVDAIPYTQDFLCTSATDPSGQEMVTLTRAGVEFSDPVKDSYGLPVGYDAHVVYRGVESYSAVGYYTAEAVFQTEVEEAGINSYVIVAEYEPTDAPVATSVTRPAEPEPDASANEANIDDDVIPLTGPASEAWSLLSLLFGIVALIIGILTLFTAVRKKKEPEYKESDLIWHPDEDHDNGGEWVKPPFYRKRNFLKIATVILCMAPIMLFLLLENFLLQMVWMTIWTPLIAAFFVIAMVVFIIQLVMTKPVESKIHLGDGEMAKVS